MSDTWKHIYIILLMVLAGLAIYVFHSRPADIQYHSHNIDSVRVERIPVYSPSPNNQPVRVIIQQKAEPEARKEAEQDKIITGVKVMPGEIDVQTIDTAGHRQEERYKVDPESTATITNKGVEEKKKTRAGRIIQKSGKIALRSLEIIGALAILITVAK